MLFEFLCFSNQLLIDLIMVNYAVQVHRTNMITILSKLMVLLLLVIDTKVVVSQTVYPDGGRNVIPVVRNKPSRLPYNDGTVMAHIVGSAGMNFLYYFHVLGVSCENADPQFYKIIQKDFEFCLNKTGPIPADLRNTPLGSIPKPCVDWKIHRPCYKNLADDYDECLVNRPGLVKKGTDALRFTHAYAKFICGNIADTEAHLLDRYTKHDMIVDGVFQCFPHLQDRIVNCVKRDKVSKTLCSKFYIVHACFGKYYNDDNCQDVQPIYYMDDLFRNMSASLSCPKDENEWTNRPGPTSGPYPENPTTGWTHEPPKKGWTSREEHSMKENPWPGERGRPWSNNDHKPFIRGDQQRGWTENHHHPPSHEHQDNNGKGLGWQRSHEHDHGSLTMDPHANRPMPDSNFNQGPWVDVMDRGTSGMGNPWDNHDRRNPNEIDSARGGYSTTRGPTSSYPSVTKGHASTLSGSGRDNFYYSTTPTTRGPGGGWARHDSLPPARFAVTRTPQDTAETGDQKFYDTHSGPSPLASTTSNNDLGYNFYSFE